MKILMLFQTSPYPSDLGPAKRNTPFFLENLKRHEVSVLAFGTRQQEKRFRELYGHRCKHIVFVDARKPRAVRFLLRIWNVLVGHNSERLFSRKFARAFRRLLNMERFDLVHCCTPFFGYFDLPCNIPCVGDAHNVAFDYFKRVYKQSHNRLLRLYHYLDYRHMLREEPKITRKFDVVLATTDIDREKLRQLLPSQEIVTIPNGVDEAFFETLSVPEEPNSILFTGYISYPPNYQGMMYFLDKVFPLILDLVPEARLYIVGANPPKTLQRRARENVVVTGWVDDVRPYFSRTRVFAIPLLVGGGIRGKALEAMAMRRPIVTTTVGCEGINLKHEDSALFADTPADFARAIVRLFEDESLRERLTSRAYNNVVEGYSWERNGLALERVYDSLAKSTVR
jgi:glycosyltransferase involved in cell wall biosynthesis